MEKIFSKLLKTAIYNETCKTRNIKLDKLQYEMQRIIESDENPLNLNNNQRMILWSSLSMFNFLLEEK